MQYGPRHIEFNQDNWDTSSTSSADDTYYSSDDDYTSDEDFYSEDFDDNYRHHYEQQMMNQIDLDSHVVDQNIMYADETDEFYN